MMGGLCNLRSIYLGFILGAAFTLKPLLSSVADARVDPGVTCQTIEGFGASLMLPQRSITTVSLTGAMKTRVAQEAAISPTLINLERNYPNPSHFTTTLLLVK